MAIKQYKPTSPGRRGMSTLDNSELSKVAPEKSLLRPKKKTAGKNSYGRITSRHKGGGNRQKYRVIDFKRNKDGIPAKVESIQYDPNRSANIALLVYADGEKRYILAPLGLNVGDEVLSGPNADIKAGNSLPLENIPDGTVVHNIQMQPNKDAQIAESAGTSAQLMGKEGKYAILRMPSGEMRYVLVKCKATIGRVGNINYSNVTIGKAGRTRHMGIRPSVRGVAMNPIDHPHGGGEGKSPIGMPTPVSPWGQPALGYKTRKKKSRAKGMIIKRIN